MGSVEVPAVLYRHEFWKLKVTGRTGNPRYEVLKKNYRSVMGHWEQGYKGETSKE